jgi:hypothetical protein
MVTTLAARPGAPPFAVGGGEGAALRIPFGDRDHRRPEPEPAPHPVHAPRRLPLLARSTGSSIGISIAVTWFSCFGQADWNQLVGHINPVNPALRQRLQASGMHLAIPTAVAVLANALGRQSLMLAVTQVFFLIAVTFALMLALLLLLKGRGRRR